MRVFHADRKRILKTEDSLAERGGFELPVPLISTAFELAEKKKRPNTLEPGL
jgi:hypothetical protein